MEALVPSPELASSEPQILFAGDVIPRTNEPAIGDATAIKKSATRRWRDSLVLHYALLLAIIAFGGALRFAYLDHPSIWGDEALTFGRVYGTFDDLMHRLQNAGFGPLHYELLWLIGQHVLLTPFMMRLVPAIAGTLLIPAMYWLSAQLIGRRAALLTALLTATSAYLLNYSRDAKMYSPFWFFAVLNAASLIYWLRGRTPFGWCLWLASGTAMVGFDALGWIIVAVEWMIVLTARSANWLSLPRLIVLIVFAAIDWILTVGVAVGAVLLAAHAAGGWMKGLAIGAIVAGLARALWLAIDWVRTRPRVDQTDLTEPKPIAFTCPGERTLARPIADYMAHFRWPPLALFIFGVLIMAAGPFGYYFDFNRFVKQVDDRGWGGTGIEWVEHYNAGRSGPSLVGYTASAFLTSWEWPRETDAPRVEPRTLRLLSASVILIAAVLALGLLPLPWSRKLTPHHAIRGWRAGLWLALWMAVPPYAFYSVSVKDHEGPADWWLAAHDLFRNPAAVAILVVLSLGWFWMAGRSWRERLIHVAQFLAIVATTLLVIQAIYHFYPQLDRRLAENSEGWRSHGSVWMPRYVAVVLPAFMIAVTALLWRLPARPLRWMAVLLLVGVNLAVHGARVFAGSEPPTAQIVADIIASQNPDHGDVLVRSYFQPSMQSGGAEPGTVSLRSSTVRYYFKMLSPRTNPPNQIIDTQMRYMIRPPHFNWMTFSGYIVNDVRASPHLKTFITWERLQPGQIDLTNKTLDTLESEWRMQSEQNFAVRDHWKWEDTCTLRRRVYVRLTSPATQP